MSTPMAFSKDHRGHLDRYRAGWHMSLLHLPNMLCRCLKTSLGIQKNTAARLGRSAHAIGLAVKHAVRMRQAVREEVCPAPVEEHHSELHKLQ